MRFARRWGDTSIAIKLFGIMGLLALTAVAAGWSGVHVTHVYRDKVAAMRRASERAVTGERINALINAVVMDSRGIYMAKDRGDVEKFGKPLLDNLRRIEEQTAHWSDLMEPDARALFQECADKLRQFILLRVELVEAARAMGAEAANRIGNNDANRSTREALNKTVVALARRNNDDIARLADEMARFEQTASTVVPAVTAAGIALTAILAAWMVIGGITRPLSRMTSALRQLANGDLHAPVEVRNRGGEIGHIAEALEVFRTQAQENQRLKVEREEQQRSTEDAKRLALVQMVETIEDTSGVAMQEIGRQCEGLAATAGEMRTRADRIGLAARGAGVALVAASANAQTVAGAAEELGCSIREISVQIERGTQTIARAIDASGEARSIMDALNERVGQISTVSDMISGIASQTNLLALNATIEAARAGMAGKGFAVVASEVKQLAAQTAGSTQDITRLIGDVRSATALACDAVARFEAMISEISASSGNIAAAIVEQGAATAEIARNIAETADAVREMNERGAVVANEAELGQRQAEGVLRSTNELGTAVVELKSMVIRTVRGSAAEVDRRLVRRVTVDLPCQLEAVDGSMHDAEVADISEGGARIKGSCPLTAGAKGRLHLRGLRTPVKFSVLSRAESELRVVFSADSECVSMIRSFLEQLECRAAA